MTLLIQRAQEASCKVDGSVISEIGKGILVFIGVEKGDSPEICKQLSNKCVNLRIFDDSAGKLNLSVIDIKGEMLVISQFTLCADCNKGLRPSFDKSADRETAINFYKQFIENVRNAGIKVGEGVFGAHMKIELVNDGPVTFILTDK